MDNLFVWLFLGPFVYSIELGGPIIGLLVGGYLRAVLGFRFWITLGVTFTTSFLYYMIVVPSNTLFGALLLVKALMAIHSALLLTFLLWIFDKIWVHYRKKSDQQPTKK
ncbi:hypothetical protein J31TS6_34990 [Brevibacillus reuszeri]|uniref:hypothetical protein n=1 Tax=Brevibacillus reuszeri TaxID=54915 RepID=UPI001B19DED1|nr:hypothetical protein [Brevibacillus reuszeri]GIO07471.1 hypothetical protein J31TS6_34990 [Brevibacillus reuszeri]